MSNGEWHGGKGSQPRPFSVDQKTFEENWKRIFQKDVKEEKPEPKGAESQN